MQWKRAHRPPRGRASCTSGDGTEEGLALAGAELTRYQNVTALGSVVDVFADCGMD